MNYKQSYCYKCCVLFFLVNSVFVVLHFSLEVERDSIQVRIKRVSVSSDPSGPLFHNNITFFEPKDRLISQSDRTTDNLPGNSANLDWPVKLSSILYRIRFTLEGRCLGVSNRKEPVIKFCNPLENDAFLFNDGELRSEELKSCLGVNRANTNILAFVDCKNAIKLQVENNSLVKIPVHESEVKLCFSALDYGEDSKWEPTNQPKLGAKVGLTECQKGLTAVELLEETAFLKDRAALSLPLPEMSDNKCNFTACGINKRVPPVRKLPADHIERCHDLSQCVTVVTKTARRPLFVIRLAKSLRKILKVDLPMVVIDDGPGRCTV